MMLLMLLHYTTWISTTFWIIWSLNEDNKAYKGWLWIWREWIAMGNLLYMYNITSMILSLLWDIDSNYRGKNMLPPLQTFLMLGIIALTLTWNHLLWVTERDMLVFCLLMCERKWKTLGKRMRKNVSRDE